MATKIITPALKKPKFRKESIHYTLKFFFVLLQFTGFLPVQGIASSSQDLRFKWLSWPLLYSFYIFIFSCVLCGFQVYHFFTVGQDITIENVIYALTATFSLIFFIDLARQWPELMRRWCLIDEKFNSIYGYPKFLKLKSSLILAFYMILVLGECLSFVYVKNLINSDGTSPSIKQIVEHMYVYIFYYVSYNTFLVVLVALPSLITFVALSLIDIFLILISLSIAFRFYQINEKLEQHKKKNSSINFWMTLRKNYSEMGNLCSEINGKIANIIILSYGSNMMMLLIQLRTFISDEFGREIIIFYYYSFSFLLTRLLGVYYFSSRINAESRRPIRILFAVSTETYNVEIRRWYMQMKLDSVALTGKTLFKITPGLILSVNFDLFVFRSKNVFIIDFKPH